MNKAPGVDGITSNIVIETFDEIEVPLFHICNSSIKTGIFPEDFKCAKVTPIFKSGKTSELSNYRPISVLPVFSKLLERIVYNRVYKHLTDNDLLYDKQFGFRKNNSTEHAIIELIDNISNSFDKGNFVLGIFIDLSKAFDTVNHKILIRKLEKYGISTNAIKWFKSYLTGRKQCITIDRSNQSLYQNITCGVPQGSILGPLLFLIYVNDLPKASKILIPIMFADDTNLFYSSNSVRDLFTTVNNELKEISDWFKSNKLSLNVKKTKYTLFCSTQVKRKLPKEMPKLQIENNEILREEVTKFLGVLIDSNISWKYHINTINNKISKNIGVLYKARPFINRNSMKQLYFSFIHSYLTYANIAWGSTYKTNLEPLHRRQKHAARLIHFKDNKIPNTHAYEHAQPLLKDMKALNIFQLNIFQNILFMFKYKLNNLPKLFMNDYFKQSINVYETRSAVDFSIPHRPTKRSQFCISYRGPSLFNQLASNNASLNTIKSFDSIKNKLKEIIIEIENTDEFF